MFCRQEREILEDISFLYDQIELVGPCGFICEWRRAYYWTIVMEYACLRLSYGSSCNFFFCFSSFWLIFMCPSSQIILKLNLETDNRGISNAGENASARIGELRSQPGCSWITPCLIYWRKFQPAGSKFSF